MLIISKFRDYYDSIQMYGSCSTIMWERKTETKHIKIDKPHDNILHNASSGIEYNRNTLCLLPILIGFCGNIYPAIDITITPTNNNIYSTIVYNEMEYQQVVNAFKEHFKYKRNSSYIFHQTRNDKSMIRNYFNTQFNEYKYLFTKFKVPIFKMLIEYDQRIHNLAHYKLEINCNLQNNKFVKIKDPFTTYQDIEMFLNNDLANDEVEMVEISNESQNQKHGYDKWSFRKQKNNKKRKQKGNKC